MTYSYPLQDCDVENKQKLDAFRQKRKQWVEWLNGPLRNDITGLATDDCLYWTFNEARRLNLENPTDGIGINGHFSSFIDRAFTTLQLTRIRRLLDRGSSHCSLRKLVTNIKNNLDLITRENFVSYDGLPYDYESVKAKFFGENSVALESGEPPQSVWMATEGPANWHGSRLLHEKFDALSGKTTRSRHDLIKKRLLVDLENRLNDCKKLTDFISENFSHLPHPINGRDSREIPANITYEKVHEALKILCEVITIVDGPLLWESSSNLVAEPQDDLFKYWDKPWVKSDWMSDLGDFRSKRIEEIEKWAKFAWPT